MSVRKHVLSILLLLMITSALIGCSNNEKMSLSKVNGSGFTYSEYFKDVDMLDIRGNGTYYKPLTPEEMMTLIPDSIKNTINLVESQKIPFEVNEEIVYLVTSKDDFPKEKYAMGNELRKENLIDGYPIYHQIISSNRALVYTYYNYDDEEKFVSLAATAANEFYGYYNGHIYHVGYSINGNKYDEDIQKQILKITREFILGVN